MEATRIILPKTNPDIAFEYTNSFVKELSKTKEYKIAQKYREKKYKIEDIALKVEIALTVPMIISLFLSFFVNKSNEFIIKSLQITIIVIYILIIMFFYYTEKMFDKKMEDYFRLVKNEAYDHRLDADWLLKKNRTKYNCINSWYLKDIDKIIKWSKEKDVSFVLNEKYKDEPYDHKVSICMCRDGKIIDQMEWNTYELDTENIKILLSTPGAMNFTFLDISFWGNRRKFKKYLEFEKRKNKL